MDQVCCIENEVEALIDGNLGYDGHSGLAAFVLENENTVRRRIPEMISKIPFWILSGIVLSETISRKNSVAIFTPAVIQKPAVLFKNDFIR